MRTLVFGVMVGLSLAIGYVAAKFGWVFGAAVALLPFAVFFLFTVLTKPYWGLVAIFTLNYYIMGIVRYFPELPGGVVMDGLLVLTLLGVLIESCYHKVEWWRTRNMLTIATFFWLLYCTFQLLNPEVMSLQGWFIGIRGTALYFFLICVLTPLLMKRSKDLYIILALWSVFTLTAVFKAQVQKSYGFDAAELRWLFVDGGASTHILYYGIRFFSFFSDAANFGSGMGFSMVVFTLYSFYVKNKFWALYFFVVGCIACYGMFISGTRGALAVPFAGYALFVLLSKNFNGIVIVGGVLIAAFIFLNFTHYGQGNTYIRRMRSGFNPDDPSLVVRLQNQEKMKDYLSTRPFGVGVGMGGGKALRYAPDSAIAQIPTDSWFVMQWVENGIVGLVLYVGILLLILGRGMWIVMFRVKDKRLRGTLAALVSGVFGMFATSYGNEIMGQFPNSFIVYMSLAFIYMGTALDTSDEKKKLTEQKDGTKA